MSSAIKYYITIVLLLFISLRSVSQNHASSESQNTVKFTENKNQWDRKILYRAQLDGGALFLEKNCFTYNFYDKETLREKHLGKDSGSKSLLIKSHAFRMTFEGANKNIQTESKQATADYCNFYIGQNKKKWVGNVKNYKETVYENLYQGINLQILGMQNSLKYNFIVSPQGNPNKITLNYQGLNSISLSDNGLKLVTSVNEIIEQKPFAYQWIDGKQVDVPCNFVLKNNTVTFSFPSGYNKSKELIIDPVLVFAASSGSLADNFGMTATYDDQGNLYSGGTVFGVGYPTTLGAYDTTWNSNMAYLYGRTDVVITKYDKTGAFLLYSTYIGGYAGTEIVTSLIVDKQNNLLLYGATGSSDFPVTPNAFDTTFNGGLPMYFYRNGTYFYSGTDIYVAKFNSGGTSLLASTFIGGSLNDGVNYNNDSVYLFDFYDSELNTTIPIYESKYDSLQFNYGDQYRGEINVDQFGNAYISSSTRSGNFPIINGFDNSLGGKQDAVVFKFNNDFTQLLWSTYLGGGDNDAGYALALDDSLNVYVTGGSRSNDFPTTAGAIKATYNGGKADGYIARIKKDGTSIITSTYWGSTLYDQCYFVQLDIDGDVYVVGQTNGVMPVTPGVYKNPNSGQFITKLNDSLNTILFSTVFGNGNKKPNISPAAFLVDDCKNIYVSGWGGNILTGPATRNMPVTSDAIQPSSGDGFNFYLFVLSGNASSLLYASYFGGNQSEEHVDGGTSRFDKKGIVYQSVCAGCGGNDDFPVTPGAWPNTGADVNHNIQNGNCNNGVFKFDFQVPVNDAVFTADTNAGCSPFTLQLQNQSSPNSEYLWDFGNGNTTSVIFSPVVTYTVPGNYVVHLYVKDPSRCNVWDTVAQNITVYPGVLADFDFVHAPCSNQYTFYDSSVVAPVAWDWNFDDGGTSNLKDPSHLYSTAGAYDIQLIATTIDGCKDTTVIPINFTGATTSISPEDTICARSAGANLNASGGFAYSWSPSGTLSNPSISNPVANPTTTTTYTVSISTINSLGDTCIQTQITTVHVIDPLLYSVNITADHDTILEGSSTVLHLFSDSSLTIHLNPIGLIANYPYSPVEIAPSQTTTYYASILDSTGCPRIVSKTIYVLSNACRTDDVFVPNTFTPNGDGENDILLVRSNIVEELYFAVYNRWGQMVFETNDISKGWDGIYKGMKADPAVFAWYLRAKCFNGSELKKKGNTTLLR